jgi:putative nucleotidyltransferase with HDIG domain
LIVGSVGAVVALAVEALRIPPPQGALVLYGAALAFVGGAVGIGLLVSFALPPLETVFRVLTDVRLLELSNVNNPLLSELALKAPGTYNHSMTVGTLAEEAAKAIGANSLFCRVAAAYHDVGKMNKPEYFVENQRGSNPHDRLTPSMSALIIASHVKDGIRLARQARLPEQIVDIIPQHHGTRLMTFFYDKARRQNSTSGREPNEDDFRYPGPKPRTREAAIFMLADGIEAAARTVDDATPNRLQEVIRKVANVIVLDGQLEECDLTFADLEKIEAALLRALTSMYHHRVEYPGFDFGRTRAEGRSGEARTGRGSS